MQVTPKYLLNETSEQSSPAGDSPAISNTLPFQSTGLLIFLFFFIFSFWRHAPRDANVTAARGSRTLHGMWCLFSRCEPLVFSDDGFFRICFNFQAELPDVSTSRVRHEDAVDIKTCQNKSRGTEVPESTPTWVHTLFLWQKSGDGGMGFQ